MEGYTTDKEQIDMLRKWWQENGSSIITGVIIGVAVLFGYKAYTAHQVDLNTQASTLYAQMMEAGQQSNAQGMIDAGDAIIKNYDSTAYAGLAAMAIAKLHVESGDLPAARVRLQWALTRAEPEAVRFGVRLRLARVLLAENDPDGAEKLLDEVDPQDYASVYYDLRGDIHMARGNRADAHAAYEAAIDALSPDAPGRVLLEMKRDDTGVATANEAES